MQFSTLMVTLGRLTTAVFATPISDDSKAPRSIPAPDGGPCLITGNLVDGQTLDRCLIIASVVKSSVIKNSIFVNSFIDDSTIIHSAVTGGTIQGSRLDLVQVQNGTVSQSTITQSTFQNVIMSQNSADGLSAQRGAIYDGDCVQILFQNVDIHGGRYSNSVIQFATAVGSAFDTTAFTHVNISDSSISQANIQRSALDNNKVNDAIIQSTSNLGNNDLLNVMVQGV